MLMGMVWALGPSAMRTSTRKSSMAGYRNSSSAGRIRWISSTNRMSPACSPVSSPTRSPAFSSTGPDVVRMLTPISRAMRIASVVLPKPGGPKNRVWSNGSRRCRAASIAIWRLSFTSAWPTNSLSRDGRSEESVAVSSGRTSGVVISVRVTTSSAPATGPAGGPWSPGGRCGTRRSDPPLRRRRRRPTVGW